jgi:membrane-associated phospholipid phosphatase
VPGLAGRAGVLIAGLALAAAIGLTRVELRAHYFTDVLGGIVIGAGIGVLLPLLHRRGSALGGSAIPSAEVNPRGATLGLAGAF